MGTMTRRGGQARSPVVRYNCERNVVSGPVSVLRLAPSPVPAPRKEKSLSSYNQRVYTRIDVNIPVTVVPEDAPAFEASVLDISVAGLRIECRQPLERGAQVVCSFVGDTHTMIEVRGIVCSRDHESFGVRLTGYDTVSYMHLKGLLLSIAEDPHALEDEIQLNLDDLPEAD